MKNENDVLIEVSAPTISDCISILRRSIEGTNKHTQKTVGTLVITPDCGCKRTYKSDSLPKRSVKCKHGRFIIKYRIRKTK